MLTNENVWHFLVLGFLTQLCVNFFAKKIIHTKMCELFCVSFISHKKVHTQFIFDTPSVSMSRIKSPYLVLGTGFNTAFCIANRLAGTALLSNNSFVLAFIIQMSLPARAAVAG